MKTEFEKNIYSPNEVAKAILHVDNTQSKVDATNVNLSIKQHQTIMINGKQWHNSSVMVGSSKQGPQAGVKMEIPIEVDLSQIHNDVPATRTKKGKTKAYSKEDMFMLSGIQPASKSKFSSVNYTLETSCGFDTCANCGCENLPDAMLPMTIVPLVNPACFGF
jgi:hypothetical protein